MSEKLDEILEHCGLGLSDSVCDACNAEHGWDQQIEDLLRLEFPDDYSTYLKGRLPLTHLFHTRHRLLWKEHERPCVIWSYDDSSGAICYEHWHQVDFMLRDKE